MSDVSTRLDLPFIAPSQAQKHVTHNEAVQRLDLLVQMALDGFNETEPPPAPEPGARYALGQGAMGVWAGQDGQIALFLGEGWTFVAPQQGWIAADRNAGGLRLYQDGAWHSFPERVEKLGIATDADNVNRLSVAAEATLLNHAGAGHQLKINKATTTATASLLFQTSFAGRAEMGIAGQDDFSIKVSADGTAWTEALRVDGQTGHLSGAAVQSSPRDATAGKLMAVPAFGIGQSSGAGQINVALNSLVTSGNWQYAPTDPNKPFSTGGPVTVVRYAASWIHQIAFSPNTADVAIRRSQDNGLTWKDWVPLVPERKSNANGEFVKFADGTMICTRVVEPDWSVASLQTFSFPASFAGEVRGGVVGMRAGVADAGARLRSIKNQGATGTTWFIETDGTQTDNPDPVRNQVVLVAHGRWY